MRFFSLVVFCLIASPAEGAERMSVDASQLRGVLAQRETKIRSIEVTLKDGSVAKGKLLGLGGDSLRLGEKAASAGERLVPYEQVSKVIVDLGGTAAAGVSIVAFDMLVCSFAARCFGGSHIQHSAVGNKQGISAGVRLAGRGFS